MMSLGTKPSGNRKFEKLSLKKNKHKITNEKQEKRCSDLIVLDESFDKLKSSDFYKEVKSKRRLFSTIVIDDSCEIVSDSELPKITVNSNNGTPDFGQRQKTSGFLVDSTPITPVEVILIDDSRPSGKGWSPAQNIICTTPTYLSTPSRSKDVANESLEECSIRKIQVSQKLLLDELYGDVWKSIPTLFKAKPQVKDLHFEAISKKLNFADDDENDSDKENVKCDHAETRQLYLSGSDVKRKEENDKTEKRTRKKLYTEKIPNTPEPTINKTKQDFKTTLKKLKDKNPTQANFNQKGSVTELVKKVKSNLNICSGSEVNVAKISFMASLADNVPTWRCDPEALAFKQKFKSTREQLTRRLFLEFNRRVFDNGLDDDMPVLWDSKLRSTAGTTTNRLIKNSKCERIRTSSIKLSMKVIDGAQRLRDTLVHEMCHAATWLLDHELRAAHGPLWKKWATRAIRCIPELVEISRCHNLEIHFKYSYKCTKCGYSVNRHSKSIDATKKCCGYCRGTFQLIVNKKTKDGHVVSTPARQGEVNEFAQYVKENYGMLKDPKKTHAQVMKILGEQFSSKKKATNGT